MALPPATKAPWPALLAQSHFKGLLGGASVHRRGTSCLGRLKSPEKGGLILNMT